MARKILGRRDHGCYDPPASGTRHFGFGGVPGIRETKLPCGGTKIAFVGRPMPARSTAAQRRLLRPITDLRHFAGLKAADTRLRNQLHGLMARLKRTLQQQGRVLPAGWEEEKAVEQLEELREFIDGYFGWNEGQTPSRR